VTFSVKEGEIFGFIGPNGAGKSTTIRTLLALIYPTSGSAKIFGKDCIKFMSEVQKLCHRVAIIKEGRIVDVEKISALTMDTYKKVKIEFKNEIPKDHFKFSGINNYKLEDNIVSFLFKGNLNTVIRKIAEIEIINVWIEEPTLEEIFLHYYERVG
jgi:ABC-type multidrug transport system ATPase subunit